MMTLSNHCWVDATIGFVKSPIVEDGRSRLERTSEYQAQCQQQIAQIKARYAGLLAHKRGLGRLHLWWQMRQEMGRVKASDQTLWLNSNGIQALR